MHFEMICGDDVSERKSSLHIDPSVSFNLSSVIRFRNGETYTNETAQLR